MAEVHLDGLRELKKQRTSAALNEAAADLCLRQGFDNTTVAQIAAIADVSPRTFSRYFLQEGCRDRRDRRRDGRAEIARPMGVAPDHPAVRMITDIWTVLFATSLSDVGTPRSSKGSSVSGWVRAWSCSAGPGCRRERPAETANPPQARQLDSDYFH